VRPWIGASFRYASADSPDMSWLPLPRFESRVPHLIPACCVPCDMCHVSCAIKKAKSRQDSMASPENFGRRKHRPGPDFSGHNEGVTKRTEARARPEPCVAKAEPPCHKAREADESGSSRGFPIRARKSLIRLPDFRLRHWCYEHCHNDLRY
jgi:hypothetical protein